MMRTEWMSSSAPMCRRSLDADDVHVWLLSLRCTADLLERCARRLSDDERARAERFHFERDRRRYVRARAALRAVLGGYLEIDPRDLAFSYGRNGKPALGGRFAGALAFNVSHSEEAALIAVGARGDIGVDIEAVRGVADRDDLASRMFSARESAALRALAEEHRDAAFFACWTRKEAYVKAVGDGLTIPLDRFTVTFLPGHAPSLTVHDVRAAERDWVVHGLPDIDGYAAALVTDGPRSVMCRRCDDADGCGTTTPIEEMNAV
jgi:4'-phosphopantetheinyl transferase